MLASSQILDETQVNAPTSCANGRAAATSESTSPAPDDLEAAADQTIAACGGNARKASKALIVANGFLEKQIESSRRLSISAFCCSRSLILAFMACGHIPFSMPSRIPFVL